MLMPMRLRQATLSEVIATGKLGAVREMADHMGIPRLMFAGPSSPDERFHTVDASEGEVVHVEGDRYFHIAEDGRVFRERMGNK